MKISRLAPLAYFATQFFFLACLVTSTQSMIKFKDTWYMIVYWVIVGVTMILYLLIHFKDPGFIPYDAIFFTDQDQVPEAGIIKKCNTTEKRISDTNLNLPQCQDNTKIKTKEKSHLEFSVSLNPQENSHSNAWLKPRQKIPHLELIKSSRLEARETGRQNVGSISICPEERRNNLNLGAIPCEPTEEDEGGYYCDAKTNDMIKEEEDDIHNEVHGKQMKKEIKEERSVVVEDTVVDIGDKHLEECNEPSQFVKGEQILNSEITGQRFKSEFRLSSIELKTYDEGKEIKEQKVVDITNDTEIKSSIDDKISKRISIETHPPECSTQRENLDALNKVLAVKVELCKVEEKYLYSQENELTVTCEPSIEREHIENSKGLEAEARGNQVIDIEKPESTTGENKNLEITKKPQINDEAALYIERRYCLVCNIDQPLRSKHCNTCNKCVARYDHHCPWIGVCIGEKNHIVFYWFLVFQFLQIVWSETQLIYYLVIKYPEYLIVFNVLRILLAVAIACFLVFVLVLLTFQTYLAFKNLTTWERVSWNKITYLVDWKKRWGSPFSKGLVKNLIFFCCGCRKELRRWKMPKFKRPLSQQKTELKA